MESNSENKITSEIILIGDDVILNSGGDHRSVLEELKSLPADLIYAIKDLSVKVSNLEWEKKINKKNLDLGSAPSLKKEEVPKELGILSFSELMNKDFPELLWDVEGIFESGTINMLSAPPNQYKSWIVQHTSICLAQGKDVFGHFKTKAQNVLIINEEDNLRMIKDRSIKMIDEEKDLGMHFMVGSGFKIDEEGVIEIAEEAEKRNVKFIVFDSLRSIHSANENDSQEMQAIMDYFKYLTSKGMTVLFTHHNRKKASGRNNQDEGGEESRGSTAINASVHGHISCEEVVRDDGKYLIIHQRKLKCDDKLKPFLVRIDMDKVNNKMSFVYKGEYDAKEDSFRKNKDMTLKVIANSNQWMSRKEIGVAVSMGPSGLSKILQELEREGLIETKEKKDLQKMNMRINDPGAKHNAKFHFRTDKNSLDSFVADLQTNDEF